MYENQPTCILSERPSTLSQADKKILDGKLDYNKILNDSAADYEFAVLFVSTMYK
jgi:hypothetical protein